MTIEGRLQNLSVEQTLIPISGWEHEYVKEWEGVCGCGLHHFWTEVGERLTGAQKVIDTYYCPDCYEDHERTYWACRRCAEKLEPATTSRYVNTSMPGARDTTCSFWSRESLQIGEEYEIEVVKAALNQSRIVSFRGIISSFQSSGGQILYEARVDDTTLRVTVRGS